MIEIRYTVVYNVIQSYCMHIIPVAFILKIYNFHQEMLEREELIPRWPVGVSTPSTPSIGIQED
jgi:hypothetical protein